jgi:hypothetical protein
MSQTKRIKLKSVKAIGFIMSLSLISACSSHPPVEPVTSVEVRTVEIPRPAPIVPDVDRLDLRRVEWVIVTPENVDQKFAEIEKSEMVFFALTREGYENLALNLSDIRSNIEQHQRIIAIYRQQF